MIYKREPNQEQKAAIESPINLAARVLSPAGSGKTFVLAHRIAFLLENGVKPENILAVTFSDAMATDLKARVLQVNPQLAGTAAERQVCTIHAICLRILREECERRNVAKEWEIKKAIEEIATELWTYSQDRPGWREIERYINMAKANGIAGCDDLGFFLGIDQVHGRKLHETRMRFDRAMKSDNLLTFPDMLFEVEYKLKTDRYFREKLQSRFQYILIDEYQDTSGQAMRILTTLTAPQNCLFGVGDDAQLLYRFAGATPEANLFEGFEQRYPNGVTHKLLVNYRSTQTIISRGQQLIAHNYTGMGGPYRQDFFKDVTARPEASTGDDITFTMYADPESEAQAVVESLQEALANGGKPCDFFVAARTRAQLGYLEGALVTAKIPFINLTGGSFWNSKHIKDVIGYLRLAWDNSDREAFLQVMNIASNLFTAPWGKQKGEYCHHRFLGKAFSDACQDSYHNVDRAARQRGAWQPGADDLIYLITEIQSNLDNPQAALQFILDNCYLKHLRSAEGLLEDDDCSKTDDLNTVLEVASQFATVAEFLNYVAEAVKAAQAAKDKDWQEYVVISTIHRLKGLERKVVFGIGICESADTAGLLPHTFSKTNPPQKGVLPPAAKGRIEDERCMMYVLVTRAQESVHLSGCMKYRDIVMQPSRFILEMGLTLDNIPETC